MARGTVAELDETGDDHAHVGVRWDATGHRTLWECEIDLEPVEQN